MPSRLIVVKVGTSGITTREGNLDEEEMQKLTSQIAAAAKQGDKVVLVTSGAVAAGIAELGIPPKPNDVVFQQAAAATGQSVLMAKYREFFRAHGLKVAQILLTAEDLSNRASYSSASSISASGRGRCSARCSTNSSMRVVSASISPPPRPKSPAATWRPAA